MMMMVGLANSAEERKKRRQKSLSIFSSRFDTICFMATTQSRGREKTSSRTLEHIKVLFFYRTCAFSRTNPFLRIFQPCKHEGGSFESSCDGRHIQIFIGCVFFLTPHGKSDEKASMITKEGYQTPFNDEAVKLFQKMCVSCALTNLMIKT